MKHLFIARFMLFNLACFTALLVVAYYGYVGSLIENDVYYLSSVIAAIVAVGLFHSFYRAWWLASVFDGRDACLSDPEEFINKARSRIAVVRQFAHASVFCGLIGTVIGFIVALSGVDPERAGDVSAVSDMVAMLIQGMGIALTTTLVGSVGGLWLDVNYAMLAGCASRIYGALLKRRNVHDCRSATDG